LSLSGGEMALRACPEDCAGRGSGGDAKGGESRRIGLERRSFEGVEGAGNRRTSEPYLGAVVLSGEL
jgi:hypothetical protein